MNPNNEFKRLLFTVVGAGGRVRRGLFLIIACACCALAVIGCGKRQPAARPVPKPSPAVSAAPAPAAVPVTAPVAETAAVAAVAAAVKTTVEPSAAAPAAGSDAAFSNAVQAIDEAYAAGSFSDALRKVAALRAGFPARTSEIEALEMKVRTAKSESVDLGPAFDMLASGDRKAAAMAEEQLKQGGETARIMLRRAMRGADEALSLRAAALLAEFRDEKVFALVVDRSVKNLGTPERGRYLSTLGPMIEAAQPGDLAPLWEKAAQEPKFAQRDVAGLLGTVLDKRCGGKADAFDTFMGLPGLYTQVQAYVQSALACSNDAAVANWGVEQAYRWMVFVPGIHGYYYTDTELKQMAFERIDSQISFDHSAFLFPDKRTESFSVRWAGKFVVTQPGRIRFHIQSDDGHRLWVAGKKLLDCWGSPGDDQAEVILAAGLHDLVLDYEQGPGDAWIRATWAGPGRAEQVLSNDVLRAIPIAAAKPAP